MTCGPGHPLSCISLALPYVPVIGGYASVGQKLAGDAVSSAWTAVCQSFADAASQMLQAFAKAFAAMPPVNVASPGVKSVYGISLGIAGTVAALLLLGQVIRTAFTHDGSGLAQGLTGVGKAALAFVLTLAVAGTALAAADTLTVWIVTSSFGSVQAMSDRLGGLMAVATVSGPEGAGLAASLLLIFGVIGILLVIVLWFELLLRNAAIAVLIATSPIAAAGQVSETTKAWWPKLVSATVQLIILKPVIALVFAVGFGLVGRARDLETLLSGMLVLLLAVFAWPVVARFFTFASVQVAGGSGLAAVLGFAAGRVSGGNGPPAGVEPSEFSRRSEGRTMARFGSGAAGPGDGAGPAALGAGGGGAAGGAAGAGGGAAAAAGAGPAGAVIGAGLLAAQKALNTLAGRMEQQAGHAGIQGANPYAQPAGTPRYHSGQGYRHPGAAGAAQGGQEPAPPPAPDETRYEPPAPGGTDSGEGEPS